MSDKGRRYEDHRRRYERGGKGKSKRVTGAPDQTTPTRPIILAKPDRDRDFPSLQQSHQIEIARKPQAEGQKPEQASGDGLVKENVAKQLLNRKHSSASRSVSPKTEVPTQVSIITSQTQQMQLTTNFMSTKPMKIIDEQNFVDNFNDYLTDNIEFTVVGIFGAQGIGKSTIMTSIAQTLLEGSNEAEDETKSFFRVQSFERQMSSEHGTNGVQAWISPKHRIILIDTQPVNSPSCLDRAIQLDKKNSSDYSILEVTNEIQSLQLVAFLFNVCHVVLFAQENEIDEANMRFIYTAEMLKPYSPALMANSVGIDGDNQPRIIDYVPDIIFVHNKSKCDDLTVRNLNRLKSIYLKMMGRSALRFATGSGLSVADFLGVNQTVESDETVTIESYESVNVCLLPDYDSVKISQSSNLNFSHFMYLLRRKTLSSTPRPLSTAQKLSEKAWFSHAKKSWDIIKASDLFHDYYKVITSD